jgi:hypothetical protein
LILALPGIWRRTDEPFKRDFMTAELDLTEPPADRPKSADTL